MKYRYVYLHAFETVQVILLAAGSQSGISLVGLPICPNDQSYLIMTYSDKGV